MLRRRPPENMHSAHSRKQKLPPEGGSPIEWLCGSHGDAETARQFMNKAKYVISKVMRENMERV